MNEIQEFVLKCLDLNLDPETVVCLILVKFVKKFDQGIKNYVLNRSDDIWEKHEFIRALGGGNLDFPESVIEIAQEKAQKEFPNLF